MTDVNHQDDPHPGFVDTARALGASAVELLRIRLELISVEWQEQRERGKEVLVLAVTGGLLLALALLVLTFFVVALFWDTYRLTAIAAVAFVYASGGAWALHRVQVKLRDRPKPFEATLQEFADDLKLLRHPQGDTDNAGTSQGAQSGERR